MNYKLIQKVIKCNKCNLDLEFKYRSSFIDFSESNAKKVLSIILKSFITDFLFMYIILADFANQNQSYKDKKILFPIPPGRLRNFFTNIDKYLTSFKYKTFINDEIKEIYETFKSLCNTQYTFIYKEEPYLKIRKFVEAYIINLGYDLDDVLDKLKRNFKIEYRNELVSFGGKDYYPDLISMDIKFDLLFNNSLGTIDEHLNPNVYFDAYLYDRIQLLNITYSNVPVCFVYYFKNEYKIQGIRSSFIYTVIKKYFDPCLLSLGDKTIEAAKNMIYRENRLINVSPLMNNIPWKNKLIRSGIFNVR